MTKQTEKKVLIVGNPNAGKTTLFNSLTGKNEKVGNWHGVTVNSACAKANVNGIAFEFTDVPGIYSLKEYTAEEKNAVAEIFGKKYDVIVVVTEAKKLERGLKLIKELRAVNAQIILFINLYADFLKKGGQLNAKQLSKSVGVKVIVGEAISPKDVQKLKNALCESSSSPIASNKEFLYKQPQSQTSTIEKILINKFTALPVFFLIMLFCFWFSFGTNSPIAAISYCISRLLNDFIGNRIYSALKNNNLFLANLISEGIIGGFESVAEFLPQIAASSLCLNFLDQSGYLSRFSAFTDEALRKFGLSGKTVYSLSCGYGCTAAAAIAANGIDDEKTKLRAVLSLPTVSCSAKTPVYFYLAKTLFNHYSFLIITVIYVLSFILPLFHSAFLYKTTINSPPDPLICEIADLKIPKFSVLKKSLLKTLKEFIIKLSTVVFTVSLATYLAVSLSPDLRFLTSENAEQSILAALANKLSFIFKPLGLDWRITSALISGVFAKESIVSSLALLYPDGLNLTIAQGLSIITFCYLYTPCLTALAAIGKTIGKKYAFTVAINRFLTALIATYIIFYITELIL